MFFSFLTHQIVTSTVMCSLLSSNKQDYFYLNSKVVFTKMSSFHNRHPILNTKYKMSSYCN